MNLTAESNAFAQQIQSIDDQLSKRSLDLDLDPSGYFIIFIDRQQNLICAKHYSNLITEWLKNLDPLCGEGLWFEQFAKNYASRLEAAIALIQSK